jgi:hypothetical protein
MAGRERWRPWEFWAEVTRALHKVGFYFQPYKALDYQEDLRNVRNADTADWGQTFMLPDYLRAHLLPPELHIVARRIGRTGNRHDVYVVRRT